MHIKRYTIAAFLLIAFTGWYVSTFISSETISVNLLGIEIAPLSISIWIMIPLFVLYIGSVIHMSFYSVLGSLNIRKYEKDYEDVITCISDAYLGKENRYHSFRTSKYKLLGSIIDNTALFPTNISSTTVSEGKLGDTLKIIQEIKEGKTVDIKKLSLSIDNPLSIQNERNRYKSGEQNAEDFLSHANKYNKVLLDEIYVDFVKVASLSKIEKYKSFMSKAALFELFLRVNSQENTLGISNDLIISLLAPLELDASDYIKISESVSLGMIPEQRMRLFETLSDEKDEAMDAYLYTLYDLEMIEPANAILDLSQGDEYLNFKAYRALKDSNKNFNINLFVIDRIC
ncbi:MAG: hypothetical protein Q9M32_08995 [Sulfurimonas sp.]|nr:hypothetical protein [Sulfurimonas sp.]MDQ7062268.1 hypothetical protein [Sulfurimonas sp.]